MTKVELTKDITRLKRVVARLEAKETKDKERYDNALDFVSNLQDECRRKADQLEIYESAERGINAIAHLKLFASEGIRGS